MLDLIFEEIEKKNEIEATGTVTTITTLWTGTPKDESIENAGDNFTAWEECLDLQGGSLQY